MAVDLLDLPTPHHTAEPSPDSAAVRALLEDARTVIQRGWLQDAWFLVQGRRGRLRPIRPGHLGRIDHTKVTAACLVGAIIHAGWRHRTAAPGAPAPTGSALDAVWHTLNKSATAGPSLSPWERAARSRDLSRWNDVPHRRREDVLALLDTAIFRTYGSTEILQECADGQPSPVT
jgi:hypothetical protein